MAKNNNQENKLVGSDLVFTRYLYVKDEVRISLLVSILNKSDDAIFWAYELFYSGFKTELLNLKMCYITGLLRNWLCKIFLF